IGLPGEAAMRPVLGNTLKLYAGIGAIVSFDFTGTVVSILAIMLSFSHTLFIESAVAYRTGLSCWLISGIRIAIGRIGVLYINLVWDGGSAEAQYGLIASSHADLTGWGEIIWYGVKIAVIAVIQLSLVIFPLMVAMQFFRDLGWLQSISNVFQPFTKLLGMREN